MADFIIHPKAVIDLDSNDVSQSIFAFGVSDPTTVGGLTVGGEYYAEQVRRSPLSAPFIAQAATLLETGEVRGFGRTGTGAVTFVNNIGGQALIPGAGRYALIFTTGGSISNITTSAGTISQAVYDPSGRWAACQLDAVEAGETISVNIAGSGTLVNAIMAIPISGPNFTFGTPGPFNTSVSTTPTTNMSAIATEDGAMAVLGHRLAGGTTPMSFAGDLDGADFTQQVGSTSYCGGQAKHGLTAGNKTSTLTWGSSSGDKVAIAMPIDVAA